MRKVLPIVLVLAGCGGGQKGEPEVAEQPRPFISDKPVFALSSGFTVIQVGDSSERVASALRPPDGAKTLDRLPAGLKEPYKAIGWRTASGGIGVLTYEGKTVAAVRTQTSASEAQVSDAESWFKRQREDEEPLEIKGKHATYQFVTKQRQRMVLVVTPTKSGKFTVVQAIGVPEVLALLRLEPESARKDAELADVAPAVGT